MTSACLSLEFPFLSSLPCCLNSLSLSLNCLSLSHSLCVSLPLSLSLSVTLGAPQNHICNFNDRKRTRRRTIGLNGIGLLCTHRSEMGSNSTMKGTNTQADAQKQGLASTGLIRQILRGPISYPQSCLLTVDCLSPPNITCVASKQS